MQTTIGLVSGAVGAIMTAIQPTERGRKVYPDSVNCVDSAFYQSFPAHKHGIERNARYVSLTSPQRKQGFLAAHSFRALPVHNNEKSPASR